MQDEPHSPALTGTALTGLSRDEIVEAARQASESAGRPISRNDFERASGISQYHIYRLFPDGGWQEVKRLAGLDRHPKATESLPDDHLLRAFHEVVISRGTIPTWSQFAAQSHLSADVIRKRFGGMPGTIARYRDWLLLADASSPILEILQSNFDRKSPASSSHFNNAVDNRIFIPSSRYSGPEFGPPINFRGLRHAPINEQGVVFLFGMLAYELGFTVEAVHASFPDCVAKRATDKQRQRWQVVRIEFEYQSRTFRDHGHDPEGCDLIVCWEHNWPSCSLEVLELRTVIEKMSPDT